MDLADKCGVRPDGRPVVSQSTVANIESGRNKGSKLGVALARALDVRPEWLVDGLEPRERGAMQDLPLSGEGESTDAGSSRGFRELSAAFKSGSEAKQEALRRLANLPEQEMATLLLVIQSIGSKYKL